VHPAQPALTDVESPRSGSNITFFLSIDINTLGSTEEKIVSVHAASEIDIDTAVSAARTAFRGEWRTLSAVERGSYLFKLAELIKRDEELIASIDAWDNGKVIANRLNLFQ
jgi:acyl-CoA reductase-like NAD-dependent aldehyde dehydrogenase